MWQDEQQRRLYDMRESALLDYRSEMSAVREESLKDGREEGKKDDLDKFLTLRFGTPSLDLREKARKLTGILILDQVLSELYVADSLEAAGRIIDAALAKAGPSL